MVHPHARKMAANLARIRDELEFQSEDSQELNINQFSYKHT